MSHDHPDGPAVDAARPRHFHPRIAAICALVALIVVLVAALVASSLSSRNAKAARADTSANHGTVLGLTPRSAPAGNIPGGTLPAAGLVTLGGELTDLKALTKGSPTVVNFFSETCVPCVRELPALQKLADATHGKLRVVGIDVQDSLADTKAFVKKTGVTFAVARDPQALILSGFGVTAIPTTLAVSADGHIVAHNFGQFDTGALGPWVAKNLKVPS
jgi:cytochrome c biogenesis protein CcmG/thiol:disulfide interchange protein DsbE